MADRGLFTIPRSTFPTRLHRDEDGGAALPAEGRMRALLMSAIICCGVAVFAPLVLELDQAAAHSACLCPGCQEPDCREDFCSCSAKSSCQACRHGRRNRATQDDSRLAESPDIGLMR